MKNVRRFMRFLGVAFAFAAGAGFGLAQEGTGPVINEVMSLNNQTIRDDDGDYSDWIELFNAGSSTVDLTGWGLSDDTLEPLKWTFQGGSLAPGQHLLVFASDKDRSVVTNHWETVITQGDDWSYFVGTSAPPADWRSLDFDDSGWDTGPSGFGYGDDDDATTINLREIAASLYVRTTFTVDDPSNIVDGFLHVDYDDGFVAYLNGTEIARANIGVAGTVPAHNETTGSTREATGSPESYSLSDIQPLLVAGENVLAIQGHNASLGSSDFSLIPFLTLGMTVPPESPGGVSEDIQLSNVYQHLNFKIKSDGETLFLSDNTGAVVDSVETGVIYEDMSLGRKPDGGAEWVIFNETTPGTANGEGVFQGYSDSIQVSHSGGFYDGGILLEMSTESPDAVIVFTVNGDYPVYDGVDDPADSIFVYTEPIAIDSTLVIRAQSFETGKLDGPLLTQTYLIDETITLPVISLTTPPEGLWSEESGIYVPGNVSLPYSHWNGQANWWQPWERETHLEFYEADGSLGFEQNVGIETIGGWGRFFVRKALAIFARSKYGKGSIDYQLFSDEPCTEYEAIMLRCSGNDWANTLFRDAMIQSLIEDIDMETQAYRPVIVFLNGVYWGIHNMREKQNEHYLKQHHPEIDIDNLDYLQHWESHGAIHGNYNLYNDAKDYILDNDMGDPEKYAYAETQFDMENLINYWTFNIYLDNGDWPRNNCKLWRERTPGSKWRWVVFDTDPGFGGYGRSTPTYNTLEQATTPTGSSWPNPPFSTEMFRNLLDSEIFRNKVINRFADHANTIYAAERVEQRILEMKAVLEPEVPRHIERWYGLSNEVYGIKDNNGWLEDKNEWEDNINRMITFGNERFSGLGEHIINYFHLNGTSNINLDVSQSSAGKIKLNSIIPDEYPWSGIYFKDVPLEVTALPNPGYRFVGWSGAATGTSASDTIILSGDATVTAMFESTGSASPLLVVNEINYSATDTVDPGDWIELYNPYGVPVDISGWILKDSDDAHSFTIPENTVIEPGGYFVLCENTSRFITVYHGVDNHTGDFDFGLSSLGESVRLYDTQGALIDSLTYDDDSPWPRKRDDGVYTLALLSVSGDNSVPENWGLTPDNGTPGLPNTIFVGVGSVEQPGAPSAFSLGQNYPNPFNPSTTFRYELPVDSHVEFVIYDILGRKVAVLKDSMISAGVHESVWNGRDINGMLVGSGVYLYRFRAQNFVKQGKVMFLR